jgi:DNA polymerase elongation subunit (family B)
VVASDTDSVYVRFGEYVKANMSGLEKIAIVDSLDAFCKDEVAKVIAWSYDRLKKLVRAPTQRLQMKRESIADRAIWTAKKRYAMHVYDVEGVRYPDGSVKTVGLETVRSSTPAVVREELKGLLKVVLTSDEESVQRRIADFRDRFKTLPFEEVAFPRGISGMEKYADAARIYSKGTPIQVRGALIYNRALEVSGLSNQYRPVRNGDKVKFSYLRVPNPLKEDVISFPDGAPSELVELIEPYVDHETQFTKTFLDPISHILASINWSATKRNTIMEFFS